MSNWESAPIVDEKSTKNKWEDAPEVGKTDAPEPSLARKAVNFLLPTASKMEPSIGSNLATLGDVAGWVPRAENAASSVVGKGIDLVKNAITGRNDETFGGGREGALKAVKDALPDNIVGQNLYHGVEALTDLGTFAGTPLLSKAKTGVEALMAAKNLGENIVSNANKPQGLLNKTAGKLSEEMTGVSEEALRKVGTPEGAKAVESMAGKTYELGQQLKDVLQNPSKYIKEGEIVNAALPKMGKVPIENTVQALKNSLVQDATLPGAEKANNIINHIIENLQKEREIPASKILDAQGKPIVEAQTVTRQSIPAERFRNIRAQFDEAINWNDPSGSYLDKAFTNARTAGMNDLITAAKTSGQERYIPAMQEYARKLQLWDGLKQKAGRNPQAFIDLVFGKNKQEAENMLAEIGQITGNDFVGQAKNARLAAELGDEGKATFFPRQTTGRSLLGAGAGLTQIATGVATGHPGLVASGLGTLSLASPKITSKFTIPLAEKVGGVSLFQRPTIGLGYQAQNQLSE